MSVPDKKRKSESGAILSFNGIEIPSDVFNAKFAELGDVDAVLASFKEDLDCEDLAIDSKESEDIGVIMNPCEAAVPPKMMDTTLRKLWPRHDPIKRPSQKLITKRMHLLALDEALQNILSVEMSLWATDLIMLGDIDLKIDKIKFYFKNPNIKAIEAIEDVNQRVSDLKNSSGSNKARKIGNLIVYVSETRALVQHAQTELNLVLSSVDERAIEVLQIAANIDGVTQPRVRLSDAHDDHEILAPRLWQIYHERISEIQLLQQKFLALKDKVNQSVVNVDALAGPGSTAAEQISLAKAQRANSNKKRRKSRQKKQSSESTEFPHGIAI